MLKMFKGCRFKRLKKKWFYKNVVAFKVELKSFKHKDVTIVEFDRFNSPYCNLIFPSVGDNKNALATQWALFNKRPWECYFAVKKALLNCNEWLELNAITRKDALICN